MIDTVIINLPFNDLLPEKRDVEIVAYLQSWDRNTKGRFTKWIRNPGPDEQALGYHPSLTAYRNLQHGSQIFARIQFSAPKLLWGNNLDELNNCHAIPVAKRLRSSLQNMGMNPTWERLLRAQVVTLHYSKNILLEDGYTANEVIQYISRIQSGGRLQKRDSQYNRNGSGVNLYNKSFGFSIYDKVAELDPPLRELIEQHGTKPQVIRLEARLNKRQKINHTFEKLELGLDPSLQEAFDSEKSRQVVTHFWQELIEPQVAVVTQTGESANSIVQKLLRGMPDITIHTAVKRTGLVLSGRATGGLSELRTIVLDRKSYRTWQRMYQEIKEANLLLEEQEETWWNQIETQLAEYESLSIIEN